MYNTEKKFLESIFDKVSKTDIFEDYDLTDKSDELLRVKEQLINMGVQPNTKLHITNHKLTPINVKQDDSFPLKPNGLWYSFGLNWLDYVINDLPEFYKEGNLYVYSLDVSSVNLLKLQSKDDYLKVSLEYINPFIKLQYPDWGLISKDYDGIETTKLYRNIQWTYPWDIESGCIWNVSNLKAKLLLQTKI